jgi:hypothetical protein
MKITRSIATSRITMAFLMLWLFPTGHAAYAVVMRHDVAPAQYLARKSSVPFLVYLPSEGHGALIAPRWVVTAAHAVTSMQARKPWYVTINNKRREVAKIVLYPDYAASSEAWKKLFDQMKSENAAMWKERYDDAMASMHDIALLELKHPVNDVSTVNIYRESDEKGKLVEIYGAGASGTDASGAPDSAPHRGVLRRAEARVTNADGPWLRYVFECGPAALPVEGATAGGDSGGPLLIERDGKWSLAGLVHGLDGSLDDVLHTRAGDFRLGVCGQTFANTRLSFFAHWIDDTIRDVPSTSTFQR